MSTDPGIWVAAILTLIVYSYLFKETEWYKAVEHLYIGLAAGYTLVMGYNNIVNKVWDPIAKQGSFAPVIPSILGLMLFAPYVSKSAAWLRRIPLAVIAGIGAAVGARSAVTSTLVRQLRAALTPLDTANAWIVAIGTVCVLMYFIFTIKPNPVMKAGTELGKWFMMLTLGAAFGAGIAGRISLLLGRLNLLFRDWIHLIKV